MYTVGGSVDWCSHSLEVSQKLKLKNLLQDEGYDLVIPIQYLNSNDIDNIIKYIETGEIELGNERVYNYIRKTNLS